MFVVKPQQETAKDIALIRQSIDTINVNHMTHLQDYAEEIKDIKEREAEERKTQTQLMAELVKVSTQLDDHVKNSK